MWIKICANTNVEDALKAAELGANAVGFVFAPSKRQVTAEQVRPISDALPPGIERIGVFGAISAEDIAHAAETARLTGIQLHGGFDPVLTARLRTLLPVSVSLIETAHWIVGDNAVSARAVEQQFERLAAFAPEMRVLVDAKVGGQSGGTGVPFAWEQARDVLSSKPGLKVILAGGLRPENVAEAIRVLRPWGVDVASGVEREPGRKDFARLKTFIENARTAASAGTVRAS